MLAPDTDTEPVAIFTKSARRRVTKTMNRQRYT
jgi:hypothetical protein